MIAYREINADAAQDRAADKQAARDADHRALQSGEISPEQLQYANSMFSGFDMSKAIVRFKPPRKR